MKLNHIILHGLGHAILVVLYIAGVSWLLFNSKKLISPEPTFLVPLSILLLFVLSATIVPTLVLGRPILLYVNGKKTEALQFFGATLAGMFIFTLMIFSLYLLR